VRGGCRKRGRGGRDGEIQKRQNKPWYKWKVTCELRVCLENRKKEPIRIMARNVLLKQKQDHS